ncbi:hypothetical protein NMY22_g19856 [Coprinellus aureogranulatus]|nr:hypothetical protein NMY22_g19856 [Coprinellus aureogranulatus]
MSRDPMVAAYQVFEETTMDLETTRQRILYETYGHYLGPMPVRDFFDDFMLWNGEVTEEYKRVRVPEPSKLKIKELPSCDSEDEYYMQVINCLQSWKGLNASLTGSLSSESEEAEGSSFRERPPLQFKDSHNYRDRACSSFGVGISIYSGSLLIPRDEEPVMDFANLHSWIEIKPTDDHDAFDDAAVAVEGTDEEEQLDTEDHLEEMEDGEPEVSDMLPSPNSSSADSSVSQDLFPPREFFVGHATNEVKNLHTIPDLYPFENNSPRGTAAISSLW